MNSDYVSGIAKLQNAGKRDGKQRFSIYIPMGCSEALGLQKGNKVKYKIWLFDNSMPALKDCSAGRNNFLTKNPNLKRLIAEAIPTDDTPLVLTEEEKAFAKEYKEISETKNTNLMAYLKKQAVDKFGLERVKRIIGS